MSMSDNVEYISFELGPNNRLDYLSFLLVNEPSSGSPHMIEHRSLYSQESDGKLFSGRPEYSECAIWFNNDLVDTIVWLLDRCGSVVVATHNDKMV